MLYQVATRSSRRPKLAHLWAAMGAGAAIACLAGRGLVRPAGSGGALPPAHAASLLAGLPLVFEANDGQTDTSVAFITRGHGCTGFLTASGETVLSLQARNPKEGGPPAPGSLAGGEGTEQSKLETKSAVVRTRLLGANPAPRTSGEKPLACKVNYLKGSDRRKWRAVTQYERVRAKDVYPGIDLVHYGSREGRLEYDFVVQPGGDPARIRMAVSGADDACIDSATGDLVLATAAGEVRQRKPVVYQESGGTRAAVEGRFELLPGPHTSTLPHSPTSTLVAFALGPYDHARPLVIDPTLVYSSYLGGSGNEQFADVAAGPNGIVYVAGSTPSADFPVQGQYPAAPASGTTDVFVTKLDTTQSGAASLLYSTYLGGTGTSQNNQARGIAADGTGVVYVTGFTNSLDFPVLGEFQANQPSLDGFLTKLDTTQTGAASLVYSTYLGGGGSTDGGDALAADANGVVYVAGHTDSDDYPLMGEYQGVRGGVDAVLTKLDTTLTGTASLLYSTRLGGDTLDTAFAVASDGNGVVYVAGTTLSTDFPVLGEFQGDRADNDSDAFVAKLDTTQAGTVSLLYCTYLSGGGGQTGVGGLAAEGSGIVYVVGRTPSADFPTLGQYQGDQPDHDGFLTKLDTTKTGAASLLYSTYLGGDGADSCGGVVAAGNGIVYVSGQTASTGFPVLDPYQGAPGAGSTDAFLARLDTTQTGTASLVFSTYLGGSGADNGARVAIDSAGTVYLAGTTTSTDFPLHNQYQGDQTGQDLFVTAFSFAVSNSVFSLSAPAYSANEGAGSVTLTVNRAAGTTGSATVHYHTTDGAATDGSDYTGTADNTVVFASGESSKPIVIPVADDALLEGNETFTLTLDSAAPGSVDVPSSATVTLNDDLETPKPTGLTLSVSGPSSVLISFTDHCANETGFELQRALSGGSFAPINILTAKSGTGGTVLFTDSSPAAGNTYFYRVRAQNGGVFSNLSANASTPVAPPVAPVLSSVTVLSCRQVKVMWQDKSTNELNFKVEAKPSGGSFTSLATPPANANNNSPGGLTPDTDYTFHVLAQNGAGTTTSNEITAHTFPLPNPPVNVTAEALSGTQIRLVWASGGPHSDFWRIERSTDGTSFSLLTTLDKSLLRYTDSGLPTGSTRHYRISAVSGTTLSNANLFGVGSPSGVASATTLRQPNPPTNLAATTLSATQIRLSWQDGDTNTDYFRIERQSGASWLLVSDVGRTVLFYTVNNLPANQSFTFRVSAIAGTNLTSPSFYVKSVPAGPVTASTLAAPAAPTNLTATAQAGKQIVLSWSENATTETEYRVERSLDGTSFTEIAQLPKNTTGYRNTGLSAGVTYTYRVRALSGTLFSGYSNVKSAVALP